MTKIFFFEKKVVRWIPRKQGNNFAVGTESKYWKLTKLENLSIFVIVFFSVSKSGNMNNWHVPERLLGPQGAWDVYKPIIVGLYGQY